MAAVTTSSVFTHAFADLILTPLYRESVVLRTINRIETTATTVYIPSVSTGSVSWVPEATEISDSNAAVNLLPVTPKKVAALAIVSNEAKGDTKSMDWLGAELARAVARKLDESFFRGGGSNGPAGLPGLSGFTTINASPSAGIDPWVDAFASVESVGASPNIGFVSPATWAALGKIKESSGSAKPVLSDPVAGPTGTVTRSIGGVPVLVTPAVPDGEAWVMDGNLVVAVVRLDGDVQSDASAKFTSDSTVIRVVSRVNFGVPNAGVVAKIKASA